MTTTATAITKTQPPPITPLEFEPSDFAQAERMARKLGFTQTAYTSTSALWGLFCLRDNPERNPNATRFNGCIIKTKEFGLMFVADAEDLVMDQPTNQHPCQWRGKGEKEQDE